MYGECTYRYVRKYVVFDQIETDWESLGNYDANASHHRIGQEKQLCKKARDKTKRSQRSLICTSKVQVLTERQGPKNTAEEEAHRGFSGSSRPAGALFITNQATPAIITNLENILPTSSPWKKPTGVTPRGSALS